MPCDDVIETHDTFFCVSSFKGDSIRTVRTKNATKCAITVLEFMPEIPLARLPKFTCENVDKIPHISSVVLMPLCYKVAFILD